MTCSILDQLILMLKGNAPVVPWGAPAKDVQGDVCHVVVLGIVVCALTDVSIKLSA